MSFCRGVVVSPGRVWGVTDGSSWRARHFKPLRGWRKNHEESISMVSFFFQRLILNAKIDGDKLDWANIVSVVPVYHQGPPTAFNPHPLPQKIPYMKGVRARCWKCCKCNPDCRLIWNPPCLGGQFRMIWALPLLIKNCKRWLMMPQSQNLSAPWKFESRSS